jgi:hypothetical protein
MILYRFFLYDREQEQQSRSASNLEKLFSKAPWSVEAQVIRFHWIPDLVQVLIPPVPVSALVFLLERQ